MTPAQIITDLTALRTELLEMCTQEVKCGQSGRALALLDVSETVLRIALKIERHEKEELEKHLVNLAAIAGAPNRARAAAIVKQAKQEPVERPFTPEERPIFDPIPAAPTKPWYEEYMTYPAPTSPFVLDPAAFLGTDQGTEVVVSPSTAYVEEACAGDPPATQDAGAGEQGEAATPVLAPCTGTEGDFGSGNGGEASQSVTEAGADEAPAQDVSTLPPLAPYEGPWDVGAKPGTAFLIPGESRVLTEADVGCTFAVAPPVNSNPAVSVIVQADGSPSLNVTVPLPPQAQADLEDLQEPADEPGVVRGTLLSIDTIRRLAITSDFPMVDLHKDHIGPLLLLKDGKPVVQRHLIDSYNPGGQEATWLMIVLRINKILERTGLKIVRAGRHQRTASLSQWKLTEGR